MPGSVLLGHSRLESLLPYLGGRSPRSIFWTSSVVIGGGRPGSVTSLMKDRAKDEECVPVPDNPDDIDRPARRSPADPRHCGNPIKGEYE